MKTWKVGLKFILCPNPNKIKISEVIVGAKGVYVCDLISE